MAVKHHEDGTFSVTVGERTWWAYKLNEAIEYALEDIARNNKGLAIW